IITASDWEHEQVGRALDRLATLPVEARQPVRMFPIRNRSVEEIMELLQQLIDAGILSAEASYGSAGAFDAAAASQTTLRPPPAGLSPTSPAPVTSGG